MDAPLPPAIPAATLIVVRERGDAPPELLMVERARAMAFAGGATVFPGGRVDPGDHALAALLGAEDVDETAARIAAIRETIEETGVAIALSPAPDAAAIAAMRAALHAGTPFAEVLADAGRTIDPAALQLWARWRPAHRAARIFDTRFYLAALPDGAPAASVDATENVRLAWASAQGTLAAADAGRVAIIFPTRRNLERLARFGSHDALVTHARAHPVRTITPWEEVRAGVAHLAIPDDLGYPVTAVPLEAAMRG